MSNFSFFKGDWEVLAKLGESVEHNLYNDPHTSIMKLRLLGESIAKAVLASDNIRETYDTKQVDRLNTMKKEGLAEPEMLDIFHTLRRKGNSALTDLGKTLYPTINELTEWGSKYIDNCKGVPR